MNLHEIWIVLTKEFMDALRDRRAVMAGLLFALLGPAVLAAALHALIAAERDDASAPLHLTGAQRAPGLVAHLAAAGVVLIPGAGAPADLLRQFPSALVLAIPEQVPGDLARGRSARIELWADMARSDAGRRAERIQALVAGYAAQLQEQRLLAAGVAAPPALALELRDTASAGGKAALVLGMLPIFWLLGVFVGGAHVALDSVGGERERRSLEVLLAQPVAPAFLFMGKWLTASCFGFITAAAGLLLSALALTRLALHEIGAALMPDAAQLADALLVLLPLSLLVAAVQCSLALHARSHKEAQTYISLLQMAPMLLVVQQAGGGASATWPLIPLFSQHQQLAGLLAGTPLPLMTQALGQCISVAAAGMLIWAASRKLGSERFVFGL